MSSAAASINDTYGAETLTNVLPNKILLMIFRFLKYDDLIRAEQVCSQWKAAVEKCFADEKRLDIPFSISENCSNALNRMRRYGSSIQTLKIELIEKCESSKFNWAIEIADRFPNLLTMELWCIRITDDGFKCLSTKCPQLESVALHDCSFTNEGLRVFLQALPGIKELKIDTYDDVPGLRPKCYSPVKADFSVVFSNCRNLHTLVVGGDVGGSDPTSFSRFCKECVNLRSLEIHDSKTPKEMFAQIEHCSLLEKLRLEDCRAVDDSTLIRISKGCPNLRKVALLTLPLVSDRGWKCFAGCKNLDSFSANSEEMTDATLVGLSKCVNLRKVKLSSSELLETASWVSDQGCAALLAHCPRLEVLDVRECVEVGDRTVALAIETLESRPSGLVLTLNISNTSVTPRCYSNSRHPLLRLCY